MSEPTEADWLEARDSWRERYGREAEDPQLQEVRGWYVDGRRVHNPFASDAVLVERFDRWLADYTAEVVREAEARGKSPTMKEADGMSNKIPSVAKARHAYAENMWATRQMSPSEAKKEFDKMISEVEARAVESAGRAWLQGAWGNTPRRKDRVADRMAASQFAGDWMLERAERIRNESVS